MHRQKITHKHTGSFLFYYKLFVYWEATVTTLIPTLYVVP